MTNGEMHSFHFSPDSQQVVYWADQDTDEVRKRFRVTLQAELKALFESRIPDAIVTGIALIRGWAFDTASRRAH